MQAILAGSNRNIIDTITSSYHGDMQIFRRDYHESHLIQQTFPEGDLIRAKPFTQAGVQFAPRLLLPSLISSGEQSIPVVLQGIAPQYEGQVTKIKDSVVDGEWFDTKVSQNCESREILVSRPVARLLNVELGNKVVILAQAADGTLGNELLRVKGIFDTQSPEYDRGIVFSTLDCVRMIGGLSGVHEIAFKVDKRRLNPEVVKQQLRAVISPEQTVLTWRESEPRLAAMTNFNDGVIVLVSAMLFVVISLGILNAFLISVLERTVEFGVMMALGTAPSAVVVLVLTEGFLLGLAASLLGIVVGAAAVGFHSVYGYDLQPLVGQNLAVGAYQLNLVIYPVVSLADGLRATLITVAVVTLSALYPALRASRLKPIEAIRSA
jgi:putative ABC transport system permease protein